MPIFGNPRYTTLALLAVSGKVGGPFLYDWELPLEFDLQLLGPSTAAFEFVDDMLSCQVGDTGIQLVVQVLDQEGFPVNVGLADLLTIKILYPDGTSRDFSAQVFSGAADGRVVYVTGPSDLDQVGRYQIQAQITMGGAVKSTRLGAFEVLENVDDN
jgi:hypothetical protein